MSDERDDGMSYAELARSDRTDQQAAKTPHAKFVAALTEARTRGFSEGEIAVAIGRARQLPFAAWLEGIRDPSRSRH
jgi:hypothetical protein